MTLSRSLVSRSDNTAPIAWLLASVSRMKGGASGLTLGKAKTGAAVRADFMDANACAHCYVHLNFLPLSDSRVSGKATLA